MDQPAVSYTYGSHDELQSTYPEKNTAVLVFTDGYTPWTNPGYGDWLQVVAMDMTCNWRENVLCHIGQVFQWTPIQLEHFAEHRAGQIWRGNSFPFRPFLDHHAVLIKQWLTQCLKNKDIQNIRIYCVYGKQRSRAVYAMCTQQDAQGNEDVYRKLQQVMQ